MNELEKRSLTSFLTLYIVSTVTFILLSAYWYYSAQKNALESNTYYKLQHIADTLSRNIIYAHMRQQKLILPPLEDDVTIAFVDTNNTIVYGSLLVDVSLSKAGYYNMQGVKILISDAPQQHLNINYVIVQSRQLEHAIAALRFNVLVLLGMVILLIITLAYWLSRLFMQPIHQKIRQIEDFIHDSTHELNTPITALKLSVSRALSKKSYDANILRNISISTKQLFDIYSSLTYISFEQNRDTTCNTIEISSVLSRAIDYYRELTESKHINLHVESAPFNYAIDEAKLSMLFGNLISNAIKYSHPRSTITITCKNGRFDIADEGIGIAQDKLEDIFARFNRATEYSGGFGIGLSVVQKIAQEYGLKLQVESILHKGSKFSVIFL